MEQHDVAADNPVVQIAGELRKVAGNYLQRAGDTEASQAVADRAEGRKRDRVGVLDLERITVAGAAEKNADVTDRVALFDQLFDQRDRFAAALPPYYMVARADNRG